jgi:hypothetical protein
MRKLILVGGVAAAGTWLAWKLKGKADPKAEETQPSMSKADAEELIGSKPTTWKAELKERLEKERGNRPVVSLADLTRGRIMLGAVKPGVLPTVRGD